MKVIQPSVELLYGNYELMLGLVEAAARNCYLSEERGEAARDALIRSLIKRGHHSVLEFGDIAVRLLTDRGVLAEITRHRIGVSFAVESTRYCNYSQGRFGEEITVVEPSFLREGERDHQEAGKVWRQAVSAAEKAYAELIGQGYKAQDARSVLPLSLKASIVMKGNIRAWRYILALRTKPDCHPDMRELMGLVRARFRESFPIFFEDL
jgi:thymidylate synthase (FAD)